MARVYTSNKRRVNTCTECRRRKQRCDRQVPCRFCSQRGTPEKCIFLSNGSRSKTRNDDSITQPANGSEESPTLLHGAADDSSLRVTEDQDTLELPSQLGYQVNRDHTDQPHVVNELQANSIPPHVHRASNQLQPRNIGKDRWSGYLHTLHVLPEQPIIQGLVDVFFKEANWYFTVLDRCFFDSAYRDWLLYGPSTADTAEKGFAPDDVFFPALLLQTLAVAIQFVPEHSMVANLMNQHATPPSDGLSQSYSDAGESILDMMGRHHHSIIAVQADLMRCAWLKNSGQGSRAWYSLGSAIRQAQDIGLHLEPSASNSENTMESLSQNWRNESKRRLWACLFTWESHMALQLGRPCTIHARDCTITTLIDADIPQDPSRTLFRPQAIDEGPPRSSSQIVKYVLAQKIQKLMASRAFTPNVADYSLIKTIHREVDNLIQSLSPCLRLPSPDTSWDVIRPDTVLHRLQITIIVNSFLLSLHRPYVKHHRASLDAAIEAAMDVLRYSQILFEKLPKHQHKTFTLIFYTIDAGILAATIAATLQQNDPRWEQVLQHSRQAISRLIVLGQRNTAAVAGSKALSKCVQKLTMRYKPPHNNVFDVHSHLLTTAFHYETHNQSEPGSNGITRNPSTTVTLVQNDLQNDTALDDWDFLPTFDSPDDILTAMTIDSGYTSTWLEQSLEDLASWE